MTSPTSADVTEMTTSEAGCASRTTVKSSVVRASLTAVDPVSVTVKPAASSFVLLTVTVWSESGSYVLSELASLIERVIVASTEPSRMSSSSPVSVTVCGASQSAAVNVSWAGLTVTSPVSSLDTSMTTFDVGSEVSTTVRSSVVPDSDTVEPPPDSLTMKPAVSSSEVVVETVWLATPSNASSELGSLMDTRTSVTWSPSATSSSTPVTVTVCAVFQLPGVKVRREGETVTSPASGEDRSITTLVSGARSNSTSNVSVPPASVTTVDPDSVIEKAAMSSSVVVTDTV